jgi:hypothetical protein
VAFDFAEVEAMTDVVRRENRTLEIPGTWEILSLDGATDTLAQSISDLRDLKRAIDTALRELQNEVLLRMDSRAKWTARLGDLEVKGQGPGAVEYDALQLRRRLVALRDEGVIEPEAVDEAVERVVSWKVHARGVNALRKLGGDVLAAIDECSRPSEKPRTVSVSVTR